MITHATGRDILALLGRGVQGQTLWYARPCGTYRAHSARVRGRPAKAHRYSTRSLFLAAFWPCVAMFHNRTVPSRLTLASSLPLRLNATPITPPSGPEPVWSGAPTGRSAAGFHTRTVPSNSPVASSVPLGLNATAGAPYTVLLAARRGAPTGRPVAGFHSRTVPSPPPLASSVPSGLNATELTGPIRPVIAVIWRWVATSHTRTVPSPSALASSLPLGLNASQLTGPIRPVIAVIWRWVATSRNRTVPSAPALASTLPLGLNATEVTGPSWPVRAVIWRWVATSHNRTVPSVLPVARVLPPGLNATDKALLPGLVRIAMGSAAVASMAWRVALERLIRHAATLNSLESAGSFLAKLRLSLISNPEIAMSRCWATCWLARTASTVAVASPRTRAVSSAMRRRRRRRPRRRARSLACRKSCSVWLSGG